MLNSFKMFHVVGRKGQFVNYYSCSNKNIPELYYLVSADKVSIDV